MGRTIFACGLFLLMTACIRFPVEVYNPRDEKGQIQPMATVAEPTTTFPVGSATAADGTTAPVYRTEAAADARLPPPPPAPFPWQDVIQVVLGVVLAGGGGWAFLAQRAAKTALRLAAEHADRLEEVLVEGAPAETTETTETKLERIRQLQRAKRELVEKQTAKGVRTLTNKVRGKL
jgi:hypothetical protein